MNFNSVVFHMFELQKYKLHQLCTVRVSVVVTSSQCTAFHDPYTAALHFLKHCSDVSLLPSLLYELKLEPESIQCIFHHGKQKKITSCQI